MSLEPDTTALFNLLEGEWRIEREIPQMQASLRGVARFTRTTPADADKNVFDYREDGELHLRATNERLDSFRSYHYEGEPDAIVTYFGDGPDIGKLFQRLKLICLPDAPDIVALQGDHRCGQDDYHSIYRFIDADKFEVTHHVTGPAKNYTSTTLYCRVPQP